MLLVDIALDGAGTLDWDFLDHFPSHSPREGRHPVGAHGHALADGRDRVFIVPLGVAAAVYLEEYADRDAGGTA